MNKLVRFTLLIPLVFSLSACSDASQPELSAPTKNTAQAQSIAQTNTSTESSKPSVDTTNPKFKQPAKNKGEFLEQVSHYTTELNVSTASLQAILNSNPKQFDIEYGIKSINESIAKARTLPKPVDALAKEYAVYDAMIGEYEKIPTMLETAWKNNDSKAFGDVHAQIETSSKALLNCISEISK
ncbi:hypothetical protein [Aneurinibacillus migulanus]|uniref:hypothetical protein n=1 Tax=Aneurinibacillus migulanus TaxID=47500 RepID=UPI0020A0204E|nr:hypothetical protein [Aneurinibacillus migulanus]MCP1354594.1 hypothetical protein [Aneurinibacillus migulanus]